MLPSHHGAPERLHNLDDHKRPQPPPSTTVSDRASITTTLECPGQPLQPPVASADLARPQATHTNPQPCPDPAHSDHAARARHHPLRGRSQAGLRVTSGCISRLSQVQLIGIRINRIQVALDSQQVRHATLGILQQRASLLPRLPGPGRHRVSVHITFQPGSGLPPLTLNDTVTICRAPPPQSPPPPPAGLGLGLG